MNRQLFKLICLVLALIAAPVVSFAAPKKQFRESGCTSAKDHITALEFLTRTKAFGLTPIKAQELAFKVSSGCSGSAIRFIRVVRSLMLARLSGTDAVKYGLKFAKETDATAESFITVFKMAYLREYLDLPLAQSIQLAESLSNKFDGDSVGVRQDFEAVVDFCISGEGMGLTKPKCADLAAKIARKGKKYSGGMAASFISTFEFLNDADGPNLPTFQAVNLAEELLDISPHAGHNFKVAYDYAVSKKTELSIKDATAYANRVARQTNAFPLKSKR